MERVTRRDVEAAFERLATARGWKVADHSWAITDERRNDAVFLQRTPTGGYRITCYVPSSRTPGSPATFTAEHDYTDALTARGFVDACRFAARIRDVATPADRIGELVRDALESGSNDAEHDALVEIADVLRAAGR